MVPWSALVEVKVRVENEFCPAVMEVGLAVKVAVGAGEPPPPPLPDVEHPAKAAVKAKSSPRKGARLWIIRQPRGCETENLQNDNPSIGTGI
jgi:hypothetical protein